MSRAVLVVGSTGAGKSTLINDLVKGATAPVGTSLFTDPQLAATGFWLHANRRYVGDHVVPRAPYLLDGQAPSVQRPTPTLGEHNAEILSQLLGFSVADIAALEHDNIIGSKAV